MTGWILSIMGWTITIMGWRQLRNGGSHGGVGAAMLEWGRPWWGGKRNCGMENECYGMDDKYYGMESSHCGLATETMGWQRAARNGGNYYGMEMIITERKRSL